MQIMGTPVHNGRDPRLGDIAYVADEYYLGDVPDFPSDLAYRVTARCVARWCDWYSDTRYWGPKPSEEGALPSSPDEREAFVDALFDQPVDPAGPGVALSLKDGERWAFDAHDGFPGPLYLLAGQFEHLQAAWVAAGLPMDLYFPAAQRRIIVEPVPTGRDQVLIRQPRYYSPLQWQHRDHAAIAATKMPSDEERRQQFQAASGVYQMALRRRMSELGEDGGLFTRRSERYKLLDLGMRVMALGAADGQAPSLGTPTAGWPSTPTLRQALESALPALRRLNPHGEIISLSSEHTAIGERPETWLVDVWDANQENRTEYSVHDGVPDASPVSTKIAPRTRHRVGRVASRRLRPFIDSDEAMRLAQEVGRAFCERTGAASCHLSLYPSRNGRFLFWRVYFNAFVIPGLIYGSTLRVDLNARTGAILETKETRQEPNAILLRPDGTEL